MLLGPVHTPESVYFWNRKLFFIRIGLPSTRTQWTLHISLRSNRFRASSSRKLEREKKKRNDGRGEGERRRWPLLPSPSPFHFFFFFAPALTRLETLATQATCTSKPHICETALQGGVFFYTTGLANSCGYFFFYPTGLANSCGNFFFFSSDGFGEFMWNYVIN